MGLIGEKRPKSVQKSFNEVPRGCRFTGLCTLRIFKYPQACIYDPEWAKYRPRYLTAAGRLVGSKSDENGDQMDGQKLV
jgi:hypothetical protein